MGEWDGVQKVRKLMDERGVRKEAGCSLVEADNDQMLVHLLLDSKPTDLVTTRKNADSICTVKAREKRPQVASFFKWAR